MKTWVKALLAGSLALGPAGAAIAAIDNTHHDMPYLTLSSERCAYCHSKTGLKTTAQTGLGKVGNFCVQVCHIAGSGIDSAGRTNVVPTSPGNYSYAAGTFTMANPDQTAVILTAHGFKASALDVIETSATESTSVNATGWPYTQTALDQMQCTSCHSVHDATNPPFLNAKLSTTGGTAQADAFCARCHSLPARVQNFAIAGNHPTEFEWDPTAANGRSVAKASDAATIMNGRDLVVGSGITNLNVSATGVTDAQSSTATALNVSAASWNMGGHVINSATGLPTSGTTAGVRTFGCYSCHQVHQANNNAGGEFGKALLVGNQITDVCYGCHTMEPGRTGWGHPIDEDVPLNKGLGWDAIPLTAGFTAINAVYKPGAATKGVNSPYCVTCHDVHGAATGRMAIRIIGGKNAYAAGQPVCEACHLGNGSAVVPNPNPFGNPVAANKHHPGATTTVYTTGYGFIQRAAWYTPDGLGDLDDGLSCGDCHVGDGGSSKRATAHNWQ